MKPSFHLEEIVHYESLVLKNLIGNYGMELFSMVDSSTKYLLKAVPYLGRNEDLNVNLVSGEEELEMNKPTKIVLN